MEKGKVVDSAASFVSGPITLFDGHIPEMNETRSDTCSI